MRHEFVVPELVDLDRLSRWYFHLRRQNDMPLVPDYFEALPESTFSNTWKQCFDEPENYKARILVIDGREAGFIKVGKGYWSDKLPEEFQAAMHNVCIPKNTGELHQIYLSPEYAGRGLGRILYNKGREDLRLLGYENLLVGTYKANARAISFYEKMGATCISDRVWGVAVGERHFHIPSVFLLHCSI